MQNLQISQFDLTKFFLSDVLNLWTRIEATSNRKRIYLERFRYEYKEVVIIEFFFDFSRYGDFNEFGIELSEA